MHFVKSTEMDSFEHADVDEMSLSNGGGRGSEDFNYRFLAGPQQSNGFGSDQDDVIGSSPVADCSAKVFNALKRCYRQPIQEISYKGLNNIRFS